MLHSQKKHSKNYYNLKLTIMRYFLFLLALIPFVSIAQIKEFYFGTNTSNYYWFGENSSLNSNIYLPGAQLGFRWSQKDKNLLGKQKRLQFAFGIEYNLAQLDDPLQRNEDGSLLVGIDVHSLRASIPIRFVFNRKSKTNLFILGEPGANLIVYQKEDRTDDLNDRLPMADLFVKAGAGVKFNFLKDNYEKSGYKFSAITVSGVKYMSLDPFRTNNTKTGVLDQYLFDVGLRFSYVKVKKSKRFKLFGK